MDLRVGTQTVWGLVVAKTVSMITAIVHRSEPRCFVVVWSAWWSGGFCFIEHACSISTINRIFWFSANAMEMGCAKSVWWTSTDCRQCCKMDYPIRKRFGALECLTIRKKSHQKTSTQCQQCNHSMSSTELKRSCVTVCIFVATPCLKSYCTVAVNLCWQRCASACEARRWWSLWSLTFGLWTFAVEVPCTFGEIHMNFTVPCCAVSAMRIHITLGNLLKCF